uniref:Chloroplast PsbP n=1 Tax=Chroomonas placoidea TaxID=173977 RepID=A0AAU8MKQ8_9CRYP
MSRRAIFNAGAATAAAWLLASVPGAAVASDWIEVEDPKTGKITYYNTVTQKTSETNPEGSAGVTADAADNTPKDQKPSRMGGLLEPFKDINKGFQLFKPKGWNQFDAAPGEYDIKWEDLVEKSEMVMVGSSNVKTATSVSALGPVDKVGANLAKKKKAELVSATERTDGNGILYYKFVFKQGDEKKGAREVFQLAVNKGRLWSVTATTSEKRWPKREAFYENVMKSFVPKL